MTELDYHHFTAPDVLINPAFINNSTDIIDRQPDTTYFKMEGHNT